MNFDALTEKDLYCIARLLQGIIYEHEICGACKYCRMFKECWTDDLSQWETQYHATRKHLQEATGLYFGLMHNPALVEKDGYEFSI